MTTVATRVAPEIKIALGKMSKEANFESLSAFLRDYLTRLATESSEGRCRDSNSVNACKQNELVLGHGEACPLFALARSESCRLCPFRERFQPIISREQALVIDSANVLIMNHRGEGHEKCKPRNEDCV